MRYPRVLMFLLPILVLGCAEVQSIRQEIPWQKVESDIPGDNALIFFVRPFASAASGATYKIQINDKDIASLRTNSYVSRLVSAGELRVSAELTQVYMPMPIIDDLLIKKPELTMQVEPGEIVFVEVKVAFSGGPKLRVVDRATGEELVEKTTSRKIPKEEAAKPVEITYNISEAQLIDRLGQDSIADHWYQVDGQNYKTKKFYFRYRDYFGNIRHAEYIALLQSDSLIAFAEQQDTGDCLTPDCFRNRTAALLEVRLQQERLSDELQQARWSTAAEKELRQKKQTEGMAELAGALSSPEGIAGVVILAAPLMIAEVLHDPSVLRLQASCADDWLVGQEQAETLPLGSSYSEIMELVSRWNTDWDEHRWNSEIRDVIIDSAHGCPHMTLRFDQDALRSVKVLQYQ